MKSDAQQRLQKRLQRVKLRRRARMSARKNTKQIDQYQIDIRRERKAEDVALRKIISSDQSVGTGQMEEMRLAVMEIMKKRHEIEASKMNSVQSKECKTITRELLFYITQRKRDAVQDFFQHASGRLMIDGFGLLEDWIQDHATDALKVLHKGESQNFKKLQHLEVINRLESLPWDDQLKFHYVKTWCKQQRKKNEPSGIAATSHQLCTNELYDEIPDAIKDSFSKFLRDVDGAMKDRCDQVREMIASRLETYSALTEMTQQQSTVVLEEQSSNNNQQESKTLEELQQNVKTINVMVKEMKKLLENRTSLPQRAPTNVPFTLEKMPEKASTIRERLLQYKSFANNENLRSYMEKNMK